MSAPRAYDMGEHWRLVGVEGGRVTGTFWVSLPTDRYGAIVRPVDVTVWFDEQHTGGRILYSGDLSATVRDGDIDLSEHRIDERKRADVLDAMDAMHTAIRLAVEYAVKAVTR